MMNRTAGFLLGLLLSGCSLLPTQVAPPTATCSPAECGTATSVPTTAIPPTPIIQETTVTPFLTETESPDITATWRALTPTVEVIDTETLIIPTGMAELTSTATPYLSPTPGPSPTNTVFVSDKLYVLQEGTPRFIQNFTNSGVGCQWMGVAGQVFGAGGIPMKDLFVVVNGELDGELVDSIGMTRLAPAYGEGGYEAKISDHTVASKGQLTVQLFDLAGDELSDPYPFDTSADCESNLIIINFVPNS